MRHPELNQGADIAVILPAYKRIADAFRIAVRQHLDLRWVMALIAVIYVYIYFSLPYTPGNSFEYPLGWWGWFDQGEYLKAAHAILHGDLTQDKHIYPPLYPAVGAIFIKWSSGHPYFLPDLLCWLWFVFAFIRFADRYVPRWSGLVLLCGATIVNHEVLQNYVIPWTSTLSMALLATGILGLVWLQDVREGKRKQISGWQGIIVPFSLGLLAPTRPVDAVIGAVLGLALLIGYWRARRNVAANLPAPGRFLPLAVISFAIGPALYFVFNKVVFGNPLGGYIQSQRANGFFPVDLPEKFISLWLDGKTLYGEDNAGLTEHYPWLFLSLAGLVWALLRGDALLRVVALAIGLLFALYMPYGDLLPISLWRYKNIHYFKWTFPFLALFAWLLVKHALEGWRRREGWALPVALLVAIPALLLSLHLTINVKPIRMISEPGQAIRFELPDSEVDFIDFKGLSGELAVVDLGESRILLDGRELRRFRDYRLRPKGSELRLLFIRPVAGRSVELLPDRRLVRQDQQMAAQAGVYRFALGLPKPFRNNDIPPMVSTYRSSDIVDFSGKGDGWFYAAEVITGNGCAIATQEIRLADDVAAPTPRR